MATHEAKNAALHKGLIFIASAPSQLNRDNHITRNPVNGGESASARFYH